MNKKTFLFQKIVFRNKNINFISVPGEPNDIKALVMDSKTVLLSWKPPRHPNGRIKKYKVYMRSLDGIGLVCTYILILYMYLINSLQNLFILLLI